MKKRRIFGWPTVLTDSSGSIRRRLVNVMFCPIAASPSSHGGRLEPREEGDTGERRAAEDMDEEDSSEEGSWLGYADQSQYAASAGPPVQTRCVLGAIGRADDE